MDTSQYRLNCQEADILAQTSASPRPRRLHHLGSNARIYIAQECTTRGPRSLHLHVQEHNSRHVRLRRCPRRREFKKMPASPRHTRVERYARRPPCVHPRDTRVGHVIRVWKIYARRPSSAYAKDGRVYIDACKDARVASYLCTKDGRVRGGYRDRDLVSLPPFFQPRSPPR